MIIYVDIDETICFYEGERHYPDAVPHNENISKINKLYDDGNEITYWTARGSVSGIDWRETTKKQLQSWGCKYHHLSVGKKPHYDLLICDKAITSSTFFKENTKMSEQQKMKLSNQALGAVMMALQESLLNQLDIVPILKGFDLTASDEGLVVLNPPTVRFSDESEITNEDLSNMVK